MEYIGTIEEWDEILNEQPEDQLTVLEITSMNVCEDGLDEEPELYWEADKRAQLSKCTDLANTFEKVAADCPDITFVLANVENKDDPLCTELGVGVLPSVHFYRGNRRLWEHKGVLALQQDLAEGVLYYGDTAARNEKASSSVMPLSNMADLQQFVSSQPDDVLTVVNVSVEVCDPCMKVFPVVVSLAKAFRGYAAFGRLHVEEDEDTAALFAQLRIDEVPAFIFYRSGREVGRFVGSQRGDLIGQILRIQDAAGVRPPAPPGSAATARAQRLGAAHGGRPTPPGPPPPPQRFRARPKPRVEA